MLARRGPTREMTCIPLHRDPMWLATIDPTKIPNPAVRQRVQGRAANLFQGGGRDAISALRVALDGTLRAASGDAGFGRKVFGGCSFASLASLCPARTRSSAAGFQVKLKIDRLAPGGARARSAGESSAMDGGTLASSIG
ncbi:phage antirepressor N-terminal domain-containing protein [Methylobacterium sp. J-070]|uniref:phage antirepressor N-terminal domain-containing protein n=1 Tax=Methylobacterium sp. J-070 TaxID=2836650 RepID=UPI001FB8E4FB|nr:phage antirepressor N-terminal domain-containing protein [Methylobacterium sp. J-070]MCJ2051014.1 phage antirepressor N-terminal domain-containing protein [Methylobacterium sp. J-070]